MNNDEKFQIFEIGNYRIEFYRKVRKFSYSKFSQFEFLIIFCDRSTGVILFKINTNEKRIYNLVIELYQYNTYGIDSMISDRIWFDPDINGEQYIISVDHIPYEYPVESEVSKVTIVQYNSYTNFTIPRLVIDMDEYQIEEFVYNAWCMLEGLFYLYELGRADIDEYFTVYRYKYGSS
jgi:hypothetical protein